MNAKKRKNYESSVRVLCFIMIGIFCHMDERKKMENDGEKIIVPYQIWITEKNEIMMITSSSKEHNPLKIEFFKKKDIKKSLRILKLILTNLKYCIIQCE